MAAELGQRPAAVDRGDSVPIAPRHPRRPGANDPTDRSSSEAPDVSSVWADMRNHADSPPIFRCGTGRQRRAPGRPRRASWIGPGGRSSPDDQGLQALVLVGLSGWLADAEIEFGVDRTNLQAEQVQGGENTGFSVCSRW